jgi:hypothetical protein
VSERGSGTDIRIRVRPDPSPEVMAAIVAAIRARRPRSATEEPPKPDQRRWAMAGRREAMTGSDEGNLGPWDRR